jgi:hypothetical protein
MPLLLPLIRTLGSPVGEEGHRISVHLRIKTSYEFYHAGTTCWFHAKPSKMGTRQVAEVCCDMYGGAPVVLDFSWQAIHSGPRPCPTLGSWITDGISMASGGRLLLRHERRRQKSYILLSWKYHFMYIIVWCFDRFLRSTFISSKISWVSRMNPI